MATTPPPYPQPKKRGCGKGCLLAVVVFFVASLLFGFIANSLSSWAWKKERANVVATVEQAVDAGDYAKALSLTEVHDWRNDSELNALAATARDLRQEDLEQKRQERISALISEIEGSEGEARDEKLEELLRLDPDTEAFPEEFATLREEIEERKKQERAEREAERLAEVKRKQEAREERERLATEARLAEFKWRYQVSEDQLTSKPTYTAYVKSVNQVNFDFPYKGLQRGQLALRTHPEHGKDLILRVEKGQMLVKSYENTSVRVVFDDGDPISYSVVGPSDHGSTSLFFRDYQGFVGRMLKAKTVKVSVPFYQQGNVVFEFNVSDFETDRYLDKN